MPTLTLEDPPPDPVAPAATVELAAEPPPNRAMVRAGAIAVALHVLLFLTVGLRGSQSTAPGSAPELALYVDAADAHDSEHDVAGPVEQAAAPTLKANEEVRTALTPAQSDDRASPPKTVLAAQSTTEVAAADSAPASTAATTELASAAPLPTESPSAEASTGTAALVTTVGESDREVPSNTAATGVPEERQPGLAIGTPQQSTLERWVLEAARGLEDSNRKQARLSLQHDGRRYTAFLERRPPANEMEMEHVNVEISTEENGKVLRTVMQLKRLAFSNFTQLVDAWDPTVQWHDDAIEGRFHSNSEILVLYDRIVPQFLGKVTTAAWRFTVDHASGQKIFHQIFRGGIETRAGRIPLPANFVPIASYPGAESPKVHSFSLRTRVTFYPDGSYGWQELGSNLPEQRQTLEKPQYIVGSRGAAIGVRGTVCGRVVVYSPEAIVVEGSLRYAHDARSGADGGDYLGLISSKDVEIAPPGVTGRGDLEIDAAIYAKRRFLVTDLDAPGPARLVIHGSLAAGTLSPTEPRFSTRYEYDKRFEAMRPPGFPETNRYEIEAWDPEWREAQAEPSKDVPGSL